MTDRLFLEDAYLRQTTARVLQSTPAGIVLDRTIFYARSGGQPGDTGVLRYNGAETRIADTIKGDGQTILHLPAEAADLPPVDAEITAEIEYETEQRRLSALAEPVRARLIAELERALA